MNTKFFINWAVLLAAFTLLLPSVKAEETASIVRSDSQTTLQYGGEKRPPFFVGKIRFVVNVYTDHGRYLVFRKSLLTRNRGGNWQEVAINDYDLQIEYRQTDGVSYDGDVIKVLEGNTQIVVEYRLRLPDRKEYAILLRGADFVFPTRSRVSLEFSDKGLSPPVGVGIFWSEIWLYWKWKNSPELFWSQFIRDALIATARLRRR